MRFIIFLATALSFVILGILTACGCQIEEADCSGFKGVDYDQCVKREAKGCVEGSIH